MQKNLLLILITVLYEETEHHTKTLEVSAHLSALV